MTISKSITSGIAAASFVAAVSLAYAQSSDTSQTQPAAPTGSAQMQQTPAAQPSAGPSTSDSNATAPSADMGTTPERAPQADRN